MAAFWRRSAGSATVAETTAPGPSLDYYLIRPAAGRRSSADEAVEGILVEEFVLADDYSAVGLNTAGWTPAEGRWWSSAEFSRGVRADPRLRARLVASDRGGARDAYRRLGGGELPDEATLRGHFRDYAPLATSAPLWLNSDPAPEGYHDKRVYRILFANELTRDQLADLRTVWRLTPAGDGSRVVGSARLPLAGDLFTWDLRRIGAGVAWCLDLTACLRAAPEPGGASRLGAHPAIGALLRELIAVMRRHGLIPVTIERFA